MLAFTDTQIMAFIGQYLWPLTRLGAFFMVVPIFGSQLVNMRIRMGLTILVTLAVVPLLPDLPAVDGVSLKNFLIVLQQMLIGITMGFALQLTFQLFVIAGQIMAMQMGLGFASMMDPANGLTVTALSQVYLILVTLLFLATDGHLVMIEVIVESFYTIPIAAEGFGRDIFWKMSSMLTWMFASGLILALPIVTPLLLVNVGFGIMNRSAPQFNVFSLGFPIAVMIGLLVVWTMLKDFLPSYHSLIGDALIFVRQLANIP